MLISLGAFVRRDAPSAIASERPSHPGNERHSVKPSYFCVLMKSTSFFASASGTWFGLMTALITPGW